MITRGSLLVLFLSPDDSEENNTCYVSRVLLSPPAAAGFVFTLIFLALNLLSGSPGRYSRYTEPNEKALGNNCIALCRCAVPSQWFACR